MKDLSFGTRVLNGFLSLMVVVLVIILVSVVLCLILAAFGFFK
ncbi:hypothetical protein SAMN04487911_11120 [Arenibacter nanhaiticus]|uniref:Uncharacterized protein n=1 Tax=Arenibacter nanhaiticus TaxID=558155 RepID=A0A1M6GHT5_9FLAO|nr:hypothetical protein [Arenibacter nanhaiticus]SHJ09514.1 hypothetical protein SAMN04487911_11120 [Arenibacter nanhaiticus]